MGYLYDLHVHTNVGSACGLVSGEKIADFYKSLGYSGVVITDHFFGGNTAVRGDLPWEEAVDFYCGGYEDARRQGEKIGLNVFFGIEAAYRGTEFLIYGIDKDWLKRNPDIADVAPTTMLQRYKEGGAFISHAHPFRQREYIKTIRLYPDLVDACETINTGNEQIFDTRADYYAESYGLYKTAGSDFHGFTRSVFSGMEFEDNPDDIFSMIEMIKNKEKSKVMGYRKLNAREIL